MQTDPIGYQDGMNWYAYVGNDPISKKDPSGMAGCADMDKQGLSGACYDSSEYDEDLDGNDTVVSTSENDNLYKEYGKDSLKSDESEQAAYTKDGVFVEAYSKTALVNGIYETEAEIPGSADSIGHSHPENTSSAAPGPGDDHSKPVYIYHNNRIVVTETSGGQKRLRVIEGRLTKNEKKDVRKMLNTYQRNSRK